MWTIEQPMDLNANAGTYPNKLSDISRTPECFRAAQEP